MTPSQSAMSWICSWQWPCAVQREHVDLIKGVRGCAGVVSTPDSCLCGGGHWVEMFPSIFGSAGEGIRLQLAMQLPVFSEIKQLEEGGSW